MGMETKPDDFAQGRILALRTAFGALVLSHPRPATAAKEVAQALALAEAKWVGQQVSDLFIEGLQEEAADLQAQLRKSQSLRVPNTQIRIARPGPPKPEAPPESSPEGDA